jgi:hypothetical protein
LAKNVRSVIRKGWGISTLSPAVTDDVARINERAIAPYGLKNILDGEELKKNRL